VIRIGAWSIFFSTSFVMLTIANLVLSLVSSVIRTDTCTPSSISCLYSRVSYWNPIRHTLRSVLLDVKSCSPFKIKLQASVAWTG
jgi:hypothetical protein